MGKRYYCDYCDKTVQNNAFNRRVHNEGSYHKFMKSQYYARFMGEFKRKKNA